jgi:hypothetical protein
MVNPITVNHDHQSGSVLVVALLILMAITILGIASINTASVDLQIAGNAKQLRETFYLAEAAAMEGIQRLKHAAPIDLNEQHLFWHHSRQKLEADKIDFRNPEDWDVDCIPPDNGLASSVGKDSFIAAVEWRVATGGSLIATDTRLFVNRVYGRSTKHDADTLLEIGFRSRY